MFDKYQPEHILFLDIETVPQYPDRTALPPPFDELWEKKARQLVKNDKLNPDEMSDPDLVYQRAGIYAEFGRIICISTGVIRNQVFWIKSFAGHDEKAILTEFAGMLQKANERKFIYLCAHNGKEFDFPYLIRRMIIHGIEVPKILDLSEKKPWESNHIDTMELWKFGDYKSYTSLDLLAAVFNIPTPKDDIQGSDVARVYWQDNDLPRIVTYCQTDVVTIARLFLRLRSLPGITDEMIQVIR